MQNLHRRWWSRWNLIAASGHPGTPLTDLICHYREPARFYHTLRHIEAMFAELDACRGDEEFRFMDIEVLEMAIWYHDAIYDPKAKDNEEKSAELFRAVAGRARLSGLFIDKVVDAILATKHSHPSDDLNIKLLCDIDLCILGQPERVFDEYERQIRKEYDWVPEDQFRAGRSAILRSFLQRPAIYSTAFFRKKYEMMARANLARSIAQLSA